MPNVLYSVFGGLPTEWFRVVCASNTMPSCSDAQQIFKEQPSKLGKEETEIGRETGIWVQETQIDKREERHEDEQGEETGGQGKYEFIFWDIILMEGFLS